MPAPPFWGARTSTTSTCASFGRASTCAASSGCRGARANTKGDAFERLVCAKSSSRGCNAIRTKRCAAESCSRASSTAIFRRPAQGDDVIFYDPDDPTREIARMTFPRQAGGEHLSLADYLREPDGRRSERRRRAADRDGRRAAARSVPKRCRPPASTANRTSCTAFRCNRPKRSPSTRIAAFGASSASTPSAENVTRGATALAPISSSTKSSSVCSMPSERIGVTLTAGVSDRSRAIDCGDRHAPSAAPPTSTPPRRANSLRPNLRWRSGEQAARIVDAYRLRAMTVHTFLHVGLAIVAIVMIVALVRAMPLPSAAGHAQERRDRHRDRLRHELFRHARHRLVRDDDVALQVSAVSFPTSGYQERSTSATRCRRSSKPRSSSASSPSSRRR